MRSTVVPTNPPDTAGSAADGVAACTAGAYFQRWAGQSIEWSCLSSCKSKTNGPGRTGPQSRQVLVASRWPVQPAACTADGASAGRPLSLGLGLAAHAGTNLKALRALIMSSMGHIGARLPPQVRHCHRHGHCVRQARRSRCSSRAPHLLLPAANAGEQERQDRTSEQPIVVPRPDTMPAWLVAGLRCSLELDTEHMDAMRIIWTCIFVFTGFGYSMSWRAMSICISFC
jgi:hypothetical protein